MANRKRAGRRGGNRPERTVRPPDMPPSRTGPSQRNGLLDHPLLSVNPSAVLVLLALLLIVVTGNRAASYIADPSTIPETWKAPTAFAIALVVGLATATLMTLVYGLVMLREHPGVKRFVEAIGQHAAVGAILGTLWGLRTAAPLVDLSFRNKTDRPDLTGLLSIVSNTATLLTLAFVAACWWRVWAFLLATEIPSSQRWALRLVVLFANYFGVRAGLAVWSMLT